MVIGGSNEFTSHSVDHGLPGEILRDDLSLTYYNVMLGSNINQGAGTVQGGDPRNWRGIYAGGAKDGSDINWGAYYGKVSDEGLCTDMWYINPDLSTGIGDDLSSSRGMYPRSASTERYVFIGGGVTFSGRDVVETTPGCKTLNVFDNAGTSYSPMSIHIGTLTDAAGNAEFALFPGGGTKDHFIGWRTYTTEVTAVTNQRTATIVEPLSSARGEVGIVANDFGVLIAGGAAGNYGVPVTTVEMYDAGMTRTVLYPLRIGVRLPTCANTGNHLVLFGGFAEEENGGYRDCVRQLVYWDNGWGQTFHGTPGVGAARSGRLGDKAIAVGGTISEGGFRYAQEQVTVMYDDMRILQVGLH